MTKTLIKKLTISCLLFAGTVSAGAVQAQEPRLALWTGELIGANGAGCLVAQAPPAGAEPFLTERDVVGWDAAHARWRLDKARFAGNRTLFAMTDRCFVLVLDGKLVRGPAVSNYSARWLNFPTLAVTMEKDGEIILRLSSMFNGSNSPPLEAAALERILTPGLHQK